MMAIYLIAWEGKEGCLMFGVLVSCLQIYNLAPFGFSESPC